MHMHQKLSGRFMAQMRIRFLEVGLSMILLKWPVVLVRHSRAEDRAIGEAQSDPNAICIPRPCVSDFRTR